MQNCSIVIMTHNRSEILERTVNGMLNLDYPAKYEVIVVNDGSVDDTQKILEKFREKIKIINQRRSGPCAARNVGIRLSKYPFVVIMDDDCIPEKDWLKKLMTGFTGENVGAVSAYNIFGGTSTAFRKDLLLKVGLYDEEYFYYREDTDLIFRILDAGFFVNFANAEYDHVHEPPKTLSKKIKYMLERIENHKNDVLLFKKQRARAEEFFDVMYGFLINPMRDFFVATRMWTLKKDKSNFVQAKKNFALESPQGIRILENKTALHEVLIIAAGLLYVVSVKLVRLYGSFRYRKLLV